MIDQTPAGTPSSAPDRAASSPTGPPLAARRAHQRTHHGDTVIDYYAWLADKSDPGVIAYLEAENAWTTAQTAQQAPLREELVESIVARTQQTDQSVPEYTLHNEGQPNQTAFWYYTRTIEGAEHPVTCRVVAEDPTNPPDLSEEIASEQVLLDANQAAEGHDYFAVGALAVSPDGQRLAYSVDVVGDERFTLRFKELTASPTDTPASALDDVITDVAYSLVWAGNDAVLYTRADSAWRPHAVYRHQLGAPADTDREVFTEPDERYWVGLDLSRDERWIVIGSASKQSAEYRILPADQPDAEPRVIAPRREEVDYSVEVAGDRLLILHNHQALDYQLAQAPLDATHYDQWETVIAHEPGVRLSDVEAYQSHVVLALRRDGLAQVRLIDRDETGELNQGRDLNFGETLATTTSGGSPNWRTKTIRVYYDSLITPASVYDVELSTGAKTLLKQTPVLDHPQRGPYRSEDYVQTRLWATASDGTKIPISLVHRREVALDGSAPAILYGYGSYEISIEPEFSIPRLNYLDRGFVFAIAHVRGGGELGRGWYEDGKLGAKRNTFTDYLACANELVRAGYTRHDRLGGIGGSAGGLLIGAAINLAPETFKAVHAAVPFVDALTTILNPELPLTVTEWQEWGNPLADPQAYAYMRSYTPYENITDQPYPAILATTSLNDTRVYYTEPAKWIAQLRHTTRPATDHTILLKTEMAAGHGGVSGRYQRWHELAFEQAWLIDQLVPG